MNTANNKLNERQEKFCQEIMIGKTQRQAYYSAYPSSLKWKPETVDSKASVMVNNGKVLARLEELRVEASKRNKITRNDLIEHLKSIGFADIDASKIEIKDKIKAIEVMAKILGYDKPEPNINNSQIETDALSKALEELAGEIDAD